LKIGSYISTIKTLLFYDFWQPMSGVIKIGIADLANFGLEPFHYNFNNLMQSSLFETSVMLPKLLIEKVLFKNIVG